MLLPSTASKPNRQRWLVGILLACGIACFFTSCEKSARKPATGPEIVTITLPPPPPPPLPPKVEPPPPKEEPVEQEMVEQEPVAEDEPPPEATPPETPPADALGTGITGNGPDMGLAGRGDGGGPRIGGGGRRSGGGKWGYYASKVQATVANALRGHPATRTAAFNLQVRVWADDTGNITRASLVGSSGNAAVDRAIEGQILTGLRLPEPPPVGMPMPITLRLSARKP